MGGVEIGSGAISFAAFTVAFFGMLFGIAKYLGSRFDRMASVMEANRLEAQTRSETAQAQIWAEFKTQSANIENVRREAVLSCERQAEAERKRRHDLANQVSNQIAAMQLTHRQDVKEINDRLDRHARESVRKEDMASLEARMTAFLDKLEAKIDTNMARLEQKLDAFIARNAAPISGSASRREGA